MQEQDQQYHKRTDIDSLKINVTLRKIFNQLHRYEITILNPLYNYIESSSPQLLMSFTESG